MSGIFLSDKTTTDWYGVWCMHGETDYDADISELNSLQRSQMAFRWNFCIAPVCKVLPLVQLSHKAHGTLLIGVTCSPRATDAVRHITLFKFRQKELEPFNWCDIAHDAFRGIPCTNQNEAFDHVTTN